MAETLTQLTGKPEEFRQALNEEIAMIEKSGQSSILLTNGNYIGMNSKNFLYEFQIEYLPEIPNDTPCKLLVGKDSYIVTVVGVEESYIKISSSVKLPETMMKAQLQNGSAALMEKLIERIEQNAAKVNPVGERMLGTAEKGGNGQGYTKIADYTENDLAENKLTQVQTQAVLSALNNNITFIWGPPGTGKSFVIGQIILELIRQKRSVLITSHTNTAVDGAVNKANELYKKYLEKHPDEKSDEQLYPILRLGTPQKKVDEELTLEKHLDQLSRELVERKEKISKQQQEGQNKLQDIKHIFFEADWIKDNRVASISRDLKIINQNKTEIDVLKVRLENDKRNVDESMKTFPQYQDYKKNDEAIEKSEIQFEKASEKLKKFHEEIVLTAQQMQYAQDQIAKHEQYCVLKNETRNYLSVQSQKELIVDAKNKIEFLQKESVDLKNEQKDCLCYIDTYNNKSTFAKFLSGKGNIKKAEDRKEEIGYRLSELDEELTVQLQLKEMYEQKLNQLQLLLGQMDALKITRSKDEWIEQEKSLKKRSEERGNELARQQILMKQISDTLFMLHHAMEDKAEIYNTIKEKNRVILQEEKTLSEMKKAFDRDRTAIDESIYQEYEKCVLNGMYGSDECQTAVNVENQYSLLSQLYDKAKKDIDAVDLSKLQNEKNRIENELLLYIRQLSEIDAELQDIEEKVILFSKVIGTTLTKTYLNDSLQKRTFDTVIIDEASMAPIPALWCTSFLANKNIVIVGDFLQLSPICLCDKSGKNSSDNAMAIKWLARDIFTQNNIQQKLKKDLGGLSGERKIPDNIKCLYEQYRMEKEIAEIANRYYGAYHDLETPDDSVYRKKEREEFNQWYFEKNIPVNRRVYPCIHLMDTESMHAWVNGVPVGRGGHSRLNVFSAQLDVALAFKLLERKSVSGNSEKNDEDPAILIIVPYKPQAKRLNTLIAEEYKERNYSEDEKNARLIKAGTIHSFQGSEADIVIFDLVIDQPHWRAMLFMNDEEANDSLRQMLNVAVTRAKFQLYIVGNFNYCISRFGKKESNQNELYRFLDYLLNVKKLKKIDAKSCFPKLTYAPEKIGEKQSDCTYKSLICTEDQFGKYFLRDIQCAEECIVIYSPFMTEQRLAELLPYFIDAIDRGCKMIIITKQPKDRVKSVAAQYNSCENELRKTGASVIYKKEMHEKLIFIDRHVVWSGSLNALSYTGRTGEIMERHEGIMKYKDFAEIIGLDHVLQAESNKEEMLCPICHAELMMADGKDGGFYWKCPNGDYSRNPDQEYPHDGILRCKCGAPYKFVMKNQPRWVCTSDPCHYRIVKHTDLKLPEMAKLILTKEEREAVERYFEKKRNQNRN